MPERIAAGLTPALGATPAAILAHELSRLAFAFAGWRMTPYSDAGTLTVHRQSSWNVVALGFGLLIVVETVPVHLVLMERAPALAWALSALSLYALLWLIGDTQALRLRPCRLADDVLLVRVGLRWKVEVPRAALAAFTPVRGNAPSRRARGYLRATVFGDPTHLLELRAPITAIGPYGIRRSVTWIGVSPDDPERWNATPGAPAT
jgi:hypothetical protein